MTEEEKIFAGHMFNNRAPELVACKRKAHRACFRFNQLDESDPARQFYCFTQKKMSFCRFFARNTLPLQPETNN